ncbi:hypothetical protein RhiirA5_409084 [Rhizophagus irregularis]|uniref:Uncharacterized protein n=1 Tax=Rhizophagus irregularis TaxID=588596 RepID=A0A2N0Q6L7_9GLOM|nr:hypothetical protein RhiirA5_409084 [Rhizophagus irregularis]
MVTAVTPSQKLHDPWAKREAWRNAPHFSPRYSLRHAWPGLSWGIGAFIIYLGIDAVTSRMNAHDKHIETKESQAQTG